MNDSVCDSTGGILDDLKRMGRAAEKSVIAAVDSLITMDRELAHEVIRSDDEVDTLEIELEQACIEYSECPALSESDRRAIVTILKVTTEFERVADHATDIAEIALRLTEGDKAVMGPTDHIVKLTALTATMLKDALKAFFTGDAELARDVILADTAVDETYELMYRDQIVYVAKGHGIEKTEDAIDLLLVARYLERIADHATNVAEYCIFMVTGERVAHQTLAPYPKRKRVTDPQAERSFGLLERLFGSRRDT